MAEHDDHMIIESVQQYWPNFPITQHQLEHPTSEFVIEFYQMFEESMKNILGRMTIGNDEVMDQEKAMNESIFSLLSYINKYLKNSVTRSDIDCVLTLTDLYEPTAKRTKIRFKILLSLLSFYESQIEPFRDVIRKRLHQTQDLIRKKSEKEILKESLANEAEHLACIGDNIKKSQNELEKTKLHYDNLQCQKADHYMKHTKSQMDVDALVKTFKNKEALLTNFKANIQHLNEQVITADSYISMMNLKENLSKKCDDLNLEIDCFVKSLAEKKPAVERFENIFKLNQKLSTDCEELVMVQNSVSEVNDELKIEQQNYQMKEDGIQKLNEKKLKCKENMSLIKESAQSAAVKYNQDNVRLQKQNEELKSKFNQEEALQLSMENDKEMLIAKSEVLKEECEEITVNIRELNLMYANKYESILRAENEATNNLNNALNSMSGALIKKINVK